ncbi:hypothetical protein GE09DRAFT_298192 [Coniochaeta sp. 2T2.1]|nr:hypothetical protein GE09DRAFT_298192 [Coniochaeta sp. 2T2.1]
MDQLLAQQLLDLGEDTQLRKRNLLNLVPHLSQQEARDLAILLSKTDFRTDIVSRLPPELQINVARHFDEIDVFVLLNVSKQWRALWLQRDLLRITSEQCQYLHPDLFGQKDSSHSPEEWAKLQYEHIHTRRCRFLGMFSSAIVVRHEPGFAHTGLMGGLDLVGVFPPPSSGESDPAAMFGRTEDDPIDHRFLPGFFYEAGKFVWSTDALPSPDALIVVEDLRSRTKWIYRNPSIVQYGPEFGIMALGDKLLVAGSSRAMFIWHLESHQCSRLFLPQQSTCCVTSSEYVAFLRPKGALIWRWGSELKPVEFDGVLDSKQRIAQRWPSISPANTMGIFFDPFENGTLYIAVCFTDIRVVLVHKFTREGRFSETREINFRDSDTDLRLDTPSSRTFGGETPTIACWALRPCNSNGDFSLTQWRTTGPYKPLNPGPIPGKAPVLGETFVELRFNVKTSKPSFIEMSLPSGSGIHWSPACSDYPIALPSWNDQILFAVQAAQYGRPIAGGETPLWANSCLAVVALPLSPPSSNHADARIQCIQCRGGRRGHSSMLCVPHNITVDEHLVGLNWSPTRPVTLQSDHPRNYYNLKPRCDSPDNNTQLLRSLYSESNFVLDLNSASPAIGDGSLVRGAYMMFQDDDFIIWWHQFGYVAWDFRPSSTYK